jgi:hypothetical protein
MSDEELTKILKSMADKIEHRPSKAILYSKDILLAAAAITVLVFLWKIPAWKTGVDACLSQNEKDHTIFSTFVKAQTEASQQIVVQLTAMKAAADEREKMRSQANLAAVARDRTRNP